jgi:putative aldouronate transport system substrate-binding protein
MKKLSRRDALKLIGLTSAGSVLAACAPASSTTAPEAEKPAATKAPEAEQPAATTPPDAAEPAPTTAAAPAEVEMMDIKVGLWDIANSFPEGEPDAIAQYVMDKFKINFVPVNVGWGDADEKYNTWAASGQMPDVIGAVAHVGMARYFQWINDGVVRPLPDVSAYPEVSRLMKLPEVTAYAVGGKDYFLPRFIYSDSAYWAMDRGLIVRKDWMEKLGIAEPKTEQEYIDMCVAFAKDDPDGNGQNDTVGLTPDSPGSIFSQYFAGFGYTDVMNWVKGDDGKYVMPVAGEKAFVLGQFLRKMYQAGGLDPDFATLESSQAIEKFAAGKAGLLARQVSPKHLKAVMDAWVKAQPDKDFEASIALLPGPSVDGSYTRFALPAYWSETYIEANVDDAKMDRVLQLFDWLYTKEGMYMVQYGFEGKDYAIENGNVKLLTPVDAATGLHKSLAELYPFVYAMNYLAAWTSDYVQYEDPSIPEGIRKLALAERENRVANWKEPEINWAVQGLEVPEKQEMASVTFGDDWIKFIMDASGKSDEELYEEMKQNWNANGYAAAVEAITAKAKEIGL